MKSAQRVQWAGTAPIAPIVPGPAAEACPHPSLLSLLMNVSIDTHGGLSPGCRLVCRLALVKDAAQAFKHCAEGRWLCVGGCLLAAPYPPAATQVGAV